ncbi:MAG: hypothetical protein N2999_08065, partial [Proteobacteria bacterium]|nr:hypothetical protein [Pseudomonadota bacterium]
YYMDEKQKNKLMRKFKIMKSINSIPVIKTLFAVFNDVLSVILNIKRPNSILKFTILQYRYYLPESINKKALRNAFIEHGLLTKNADEIADKYIKNVVKPEIKEKGIFKLLVFSPVRIALIPQGIDYQGLLKLVSDNEYKKKVTKKVGIEEAGKIIQKQ